MDPSILQIGWQVQVLLLAELVLHAWAFWRFVKCIDRRFFGGKEK